MIRPHAMTALRLPAAALLGVLALAGPVAATGWRVVVAPAAADRAGVVGAFPLPDGAGPHARLRGPDGAIPLQVDAAGIATFILATVPAGQSPALALEAGEEPAAPASVQAEVTADRVRLGVRGEPLFDYWMAPEPRPSEQIDPKYLRSGHLHPVRTPAGVVITSSYPANHLHHHGIWAPWTKTSFQGRTPDFWNMGKGTGTVEFVALEHAWSGPVHGGFAARHRQVDLSAPAPVVALDESWRVTVYDLPGAARPARVFELAITQRCATADPLVLPTYHYGGLGFRGHDQWNGAAGAHFLTSEGETDRVQGNTSRARWVHVGGRVDGALAGIGILGHPGNFRAPEPLRLHPKEPFLCFAPSQLGEWRISPGEPHVARYRFVVLDGPPEPALLEAYWQGYATPAGVRLLRD